MVDERFRPPDPPIGVEESTVQSKNNEMADGSSSSSSRLREEAIQVATIEEDMDEMRRHAVKNRNLSGKVGERVEEQIEIGKVDSQSRDMEKSHSPKGLLDENRQESSTGDLSLNLDTRNPQIGEEIGGRNSESRMEDDLMKSQRNRQEQGNREVYQQGNPSSQSQQHSSELNINADRYQQNQQLANIATRNSGEIDNGRQLRSSDVTLNTQNMNQGNISLPNITLNPVTNLQKIDRINRESTRQHNYQTNFPKISSNFDNPVHRNLVDRSEFPSGPSDKFPKKDQIKEPAPYTVVQTYADRLRFNQSRKGVSINLSEPEITTKQGLPAVLYVKDEVLKDLASTCKFTLIGKFIYTMPRLELIRKNFILQTQLSGGVKIAHFNSRHVYIDLDNELDYNMVWTKQRMTIAGQVMRIQAWTPTFTPDEETPLVPIWISLPELPWHCYNKEFITSLLSPIGRVLYLDSASINKTRGSQARVKVQVDLTKDRPSHIWMGYIGEDITDGRWQKIDYDSIPNYCFYCKHQGHKESDCIVKQRDAENTRKKELERNKDRQGNIYNSNEVSQSFQVMEPGIREKVHIQQTQSTHDNQQLLGQDEWHTQRRKNPNQQVRFNIDRVAAQQTPAQTGNVSIPTKNTYINLELQELTTDEEEVEEQIKQTHENKSHNVDHLNKSQSYNIGEHSDQRNKQQRRDIQVQRKDQTGYQQEKITSPGIDSRIHSPAPLTITTGSDTTGVAVGGVEGECQETHRLIQSRLDKGKGKIDELGSLNDKVPPDKININDPSQHHNKNVDNIGNIPNIHHRDNLNEYKEPDSEEEYDSDTQFLREGREPREDIGSSHQIHKRTLLNTSNVDEIRDVTAKQGLSPRGRKLLKSNQNTSMNKPNTRARSRGF